MPPGLPTQLLKYSAFPTLSQLQPGPNPHLLHLPLLSELPWHWEHWAGQGRGGVLKPSSHSSLSGIGPAFSSLLRTQQELTKNRLV